MRDKVEDYVLLEELPLPIKVGEKTIYVGNFTMKNEYDFFRDYAMLMSTLGMKHLTIETLNDGLSIYRYMMVNKKLFKQLLKLIGKVILKHQKYYHEATERLYPLPKCSLRYFVKNITKEKLLQIMKLIYLFNWDAEKKNFKLLVESSNIRAATETFMYSWLVNLVGVTGNFSQLQSPRPDWLQEGLVNDTREQSENLQSNN